MENMTWIGPVVLVMIAVAALAFVLQRGCRRNTRIREEKEWILRGLQGLLPDLKILRDNLEKIAPDEFSTDPMTDLVAFFGLTSWWQDRFVDGHKDLYEALRDTSNEDFEGVAGDLMAFRSQIINAGRDMSGWNRTAKGQPVTDDVVYLGAIHGLFTQPVAFWKEKKDAEPREYPGVIELTTSYAIVSKQAKAFHTYHSAQILQSIERLIQWIEAFETESTGQMRLPMPAST